MNRIIPIGPLQRIWTATFAGSTPIGYTYSLVLACGIDQLLAKVFPIIVITRFLNDNGLIVIAKLVDDVF